MEKYQRRMTDYGWRDTQTGSMDISGHSHYFTWNRYHPLCGLTTVKWARGDLSKPKCGNCLKMMEG